MSKQVDERVVSMQFDNKQFESNVKTSMSTLDKLKEKLDFKGASKGLSNIDSAAKKVNMAGLGAGVETVSAKFSALQVMGVTALANITNSAVNAGKRIVSALTIDPVKTGFQEYETQINAVQTILANVGHKGKTLEDVTAALDELNKYADQTIYNFTEMTKNIGLFTNAGVGLEESVSAIKGFSNAAAMAGADATRTSNAMYQLSQAMSAGAVRLQDWKSLEQANITGERFQETIKMVARVHGVAIDDMIAKHGNFRETLSSGWLTAELMAEALDHYTLSTETMTEAEIAANRERLKSIGYSEEQIDTLFELGTEATNAATKVKTFSQLWGVLQESAQSGWAKTWQIIIGDFEEAKSLFTPIANVLTGFIDKMSDARNNFLNAVLYPWKVIEDKLNGAGLGKIKKTIESVTDLSKTLEYYQQVMNDVWMGKYKNSDTGRYGLLDAAGHDHRVIQDLVNLSDTYYKGQGYKYQLTIEDVQNSQRKFGVVVSESSETVVEMTEVLENLTDEQLKNAGLTEEEIKLYRMLADEAKRTGKPITELIKRMSEVDGRTLLINSLKNVGDVLVGTFKAIGEAWGEIFDPPSIVRAYTVLETINNFTKKLRLTEDILDENGEVIGRKLNPNGENLMRTLKGVFAVLDIITTILGGGFKIAFKVVTTLLGMFNLNILDFTALVGDALVGFRDWLKSLFDFEGFIEKITPYVVEFGKGIKDAFGKVKEYIGPATEKAKEWFAAFKDSHIIPFLERLGNGLKNTFGKVADVFKPAIDGVKKWIESLKKSDNLAYDIITGIANGLVKGVKLIGKAINILATDGWEGLKSLFNKEEGEGVGGNVIAGLVAGIKDGAKIVWDALVELANTLIEKFKEKLGIHSPSTKFIAIGGFIVAGLLIGLKEAFPEVWETIKGFADDCKEKLGNIDFGALAALVTILGSLFVTNKLATALTNFSEPFDEFGESLKRVSKGAKNYLNAKAFTELAKALAILVGCIVLLTQVDTAKMWHAVGAMVVIMIFLGILIAVVGRIGKNQPDAKDVKSILDFGKMALLLIGLAASIAIIAYAMKTIAGINEDDFNRAGWAIFQIAIMMGVMMVAAKLCEKSSSSLFGLVGVAAALWIIVKTIEPLAALDEAGIERFNSGIKLLWKVVGLVAVLMVVAGLCQRIGGKGTLQHFGTTMIGIAAALGVLAYIAVKLSEVEEEAFSQGVGMLWELSNLIMVLMVVASLTMRSKELKSVGGALFGIAAAIAILALVAYALSLIKDKEAFRQGVDYMWEFATMISIMMAVTKLCEGPNGADKIGKTILSIGIAIGILALVAVLLGLVKPDTLTQGMDALWNIASIVGILAAIAGLAKNTEYWYLIVITAAIVVLAGVAVALSLIKDQDSLRSGVISLTILMGALAVLMLIMTLVKKAPDWKKTLSTLGPLVLVIAALAGVLWLLKDLNGKDAIGQAVALAVLLGVLAGAAILLSKFPVNFTGVLKAAAAMVILAVALALIAPVLQLFGSMSWGEIAKGLAAVAGVFVTFGLAGMLLGSVAGVIVALAASVLMFGAGVALLGAGILTAASGIFLLAQALQIGGAELVNFITQLIGLLPTLFSSIGTAIGSFAQSIIIAAPLIGMALQVMVLTALNVLKTCIPSIIETVFTLLIDVLNALLEYLPQIVPLLVNLFVMLVDLVVEHLPTILDAIVRLLVALLEGLAARIEPLIQPLVDILVAIVQGIADIIGPVFEAVIEPILTILKELLVGLFEAIGPYLPDIIAGFNEFATIICDAIVKIVEILAPYVPEITALIETIVNAFVSIVQELSPIIDSIAGLIEKLGDAIDKILQRIDDILQTIGSTITDWLNEFKGIIEAIGEAVDKSLSGIADVFDSAFGGVADVIESVGNGIKSFLDGVSEVIKSVGEAALNCGTGFEKLANGVKKITDLSLTDMAASLGGVATGLGKIAKHSDGLKDAGNGMKKIADGVKTSASSFDKISSGISAVILKLSSLGPAATEATTKVTTAMSTIGKSLDTAKTTITTKTSNITSAMKSMGKSCESTVKSFKTNLSNAGKHLMEGLASGIRANKSKATAAAREVANSVESIIRSAWQVNSPSKVFYKIALGVGEGMQNAFGDSISGVKRSADELASSAVNGFSDTIQMISDAISADIDAEPTIRPVFDLSELKSGAATINGMLDGNRTLSVDTATIGSLSASMAKLQNGNNSSELLSAIRGLRKDVANTPRNTYSINGINVTEGSDVADAIETLVRAIKVEGRT